MIFWNCNHCVIDLPRKEKQKKQSWKEKQRERQIKQQRAQEAYEIQRERGIDLSANKPKLVTNQMVQGADLVIVMGCSAEGFCPAPLLNKVIDWGIEDPKGKPLAKVRGIRDEIEKRVRTLLDETVQ
jgi:protein-tyrosine-phosphatase